MQDRFNPLPTIGKNLKQKSLYEVLMPSILTPHINYYVPMGAHDGEYMHHWLVKDWAAQSNFFSPLYIVAKVTKMLQLRSYTFVPSYLLYLHTYLRVPTYLYLYSPTYLPTQFLRALRDRAWDDGNACYYVNLIKWTCAAVIWSSGRGQACTHNYIGAQFTLGMSPIGCLLFIPAILLILAYFSCLGCLFFSFYARRINVLRIQRRSSMAATRAFSCRRRINCNLALS